MKTTFNGKTIIHKPAPTPKKKDVWLSESGKLIKILSVQKENKEAVSCLCQNEDGSMFDMGIGWFNNKEYTYIGYLL